MLDSWTSYTIFLILYPASLPSWQDLAGYTITSHTIYLLSLDYSPPILSAAGKRNCSAQCTQVILHPPLLFPRSATLSRLSCGLYSESPDCKFSGASAEVTFAWDYFSADASKSLRQVFIDSLHPLSSGLKNGRQCSFNIPAAAWLCLCSDILIAGRELELCVCLCWIWLGSLKEIVQPKNIFISVFIYLLPCCSKPI